MIPLNINITS